MKAIPKVITLLVAGCLSALAVGADADPLPWPKPSQVLRLWPGDAPGLVSPAKPEEIVNERIRNVSVPELWAYPVKQNPPPVFIASAEDDKTAPTAFALEISKSVEQKGGNVRMFVVPHGGHSAFHYGVGDGPGTRWPEALLSMLKEQSRP